jgi:hypothetical protein
VKLNPKLIFFAVAAALVFCASALPVYADAPVPVIVELFTSEGCSSCPPADALLSQYIKLSPVPGVEVIALGEHVDYWNHGGWADPFSAAQFSARQSDYSRAFHLDSVYTPQMVVDGKTQFVGSDGDSARAAIARAARLPKAQVRVVQTASGQLSVHVSNLPTSAQSDPAEVYLAVTEDGLSSSVGGGENAGQRLSHSAVVRTLMPLGKVKGGTFDAAPSVTLKPGWRRGHLHLVVFAQEQASRRIVGASEISL